MSEQDTNDLLIKILKQAEEHTEDISSIQGYVAIAFWLWIAGIVLNFIGGLIF